MVVVREDVVQSQPQQSANNTPAMLNFILGLIALLALLYFVFMYAIPMMQGAASSSPQISVPEQVDVNVNQK